jgi:integrase/recombinase XerC
VLGEIQSPVGFEEVRNKLIIDLFYTTGIRRTELIHLKISDIDASKFSIKVLGKGIKKESLFYLLLEQFSLYLKERSKSKMRWILIISLLQKRVKKMILLYIG